MYSYELLEQGCYYLVQEKENEKLTLLQIKVVSETSMYVLKYKDDTVMEWHKKSDEIFDIVELLDDDAVKKWMDIYYNTDAFYEEDDE